MIATLATYASEAEGSSQKPENKRAGMSKSKKNKNGKGRISLERCEEPELEKSGVCFFSGRTG